MLNLTISTIFHVEVLPTTLDQTLFTWWRHHNMDMSMGNWVSTWSTTKPSIKRNSIRPWLSHQISWTLGFTSFNVFGGFRLGSTSSKVAKCSWNVGFMGSKSWNFFNYWASHEEVIVCRSSQNLKTNTQIEWANIGSDHNENKNVCHRVRSYGW